MLKLFISKTGFLCVTALAILELTLYVDQADLELTKIYLCASLSAGIKAVHPHCPASLDLLWFCFDGGPWTKA